MPAKWKLFLIVNASTLLGSIGALFVIPRQTPVWLWAVCSAAAFVVANALVWHRTSKRPQTEASSAQTSAIIGVVLLIILIVDLILRYYK